MDFNVAFERLLKHEGGLVDNPADPGGLTKFGISQRSYPNVDIRNLTLEQAKAIYRKDFWTKVHADKLPDGVVWQLFDFAVSSGIETAIRLYQRALGVADDGHFGPVSLQASLQLGESDQIQRLLAERIDFICRLSTFSKFGKGWLKRVAQNLRYGAEDS